MIDDLPRRAYARLRVTQPAAFCAARLGDPEAAAQVLGCSVTTAIAVGLCLAPTSAEDVARIAVAHGVDVDRLRAFFSTGEA